MAGARLGVPGIPALAGQVQAPIWRLAAALQVSGWEDHQLVAVRASLGAVELEARPIRTQVPGVLRGQVRLAVPGPKSARRRLWVDAGGA